MMVPPFPRSLLPVLSVLSLTMLTSTTALAQDVDPAPPTSQAGSVPHGSSGAIPVKKPTDPPDPKAGKVTPPQLETFAPAKYPEAQQRARQESEVILFLVVDASGKVASATVAQSGGSSFDAAALDAAPGLRFEPARRPDGRAVKARIRFRYTFELDEQQPPQPTKAKVARSFSGMVVLASTADPLAGAEVTLSSAAGDEWTAVTGVDGAFSFTLLPPGDYQVRVAAPGFEPLALHEELTAGETLQVRYRLTLETGGGDAIEVFVQGERGPREVVKRTLEREEIEFMPGTRGDALKALQSLPGVARPPFILGLLIIRGSAPEDSRTFVDSVEVPLIYHFGGLSSVLPTEVLDKIDFYPGNFSAKYGRAMGGIVDVGLRDPKDDDYHGLAQLDMIDARLMFEGPVPFTDDWSFLMAGRRSWFDAWLGPVLERTGSNVAQVPRYYDYQLVIANKPSRDERFRVLFYGSDDAFELVDDGTEEGESDAAAGRGMHTAFQRIQLSYDNRVSPSDSVKWSLAFGHDDLDFNRGTTFFHINTYTLSNRVEYTHRFAKYLTFNGGIDLAGGFASVSAELPAQTGDRPMRQAPFSTEPLLALESVRPLSRPGAYIETEIVPTERLRLVPAVRADYDLHSGNFDLAPRFSGQLDIVSGFPRTTAKAGVGLYSQPPQPQEIIEPFGTPGLDSNHAVHLGTGLEQDITKQLEASGEFFYKHLDNLVVGDSAQGFTNDGSGYAVGGELPLKHKPDDWFYGWLAYTISRSLRRDSPDGEEYLAPFDQTHNLTVLGSLKLGAGWTVGARFRVVSGSLVTPDVCNPEDGACDPTRTNALYDATTASYVSLTAGGTNTERLPLFHQLDLRVDKRWSFQSWALSAYLDVQNVYNNQAEEMVTYNYNYTQRDYILGLPILPSIGLKGQF